MGYNLLTRCLIFSLVAVLAVGVAVRGFRPPLMSGLSAKSDRSKLRAKAILKNPSTTFQNHVKKAGPDHLFFCCTPSRTCVAFVTRLISVSSSSHCSYSYPRPTGRAPPVLSAIA